MIYRIVLFFQALQSDTKFAQGRLDEIAQLSADVHEICSEDLDEVDGRMNELIRHTAEVEQLADNRQAEIADMQDKTGKFNDVLRPTKDKLNKIDKALQTASLYGADKPKAVKVQEELVKAKKQVDDLQSKFQILDSLAADVQEHHPSSDSQHLRDEAEDVQNRVNALNETVTAKQSEVDEVLHEWDALEKDCKVAVQAVKSINQQVEDCRPKALDVEELACQVENVQAVEAELDASKALFDDIQKRGKKLTEKGVGAEAFGTQLSTVQDQLYGLRRAIPRRIDDLERLTDKMNRFNDKVQEVDEGITGVEQQLEEQSPVGGDKETIDGQMDDLKQLAEELEKLQEKVGEVNDMKKDMCQRYPEAKTDKVEQAVVGLSNRVFSANQKMSDRQGKLEGALVSCGQFDDACKSLMGWLDETKELVDGQRPIAAADQNVLKAQIQEQKVSK